MLLIHSLREMSQKAGCREEELQENATEGNVCPTCRASPALAVVSSLNEKVMREKKNITTLTLTFPLHIHEANLYDHNLKTNAFSNVH